MTERKNILHSPNPDLVVLKENRPKWNQPETRRVCPSSRSIRKSCHRTNTWPVAGTIARRRNPIRPRGRCRGTERMMAFSCGFSFLYSRNQQRFRDTSHVPRATHTPRSPHTITARRTFPTAYSSQHTPLRRVPHRCPETHRQDSRSRTQIGRASCRERV